MNFRPLKCMSPLYETSIQENIYLSCRRRPAALHFRAVSTDKKSKAGFIEKLAGYFGGNKTLQADKARLEAFLDGVPGEYCGWAPDGTMVFSEGFAKILGREKVRHLADIQSALAPGDAAALEGMYSHLQEKGKAFRLNVQNFDSTKTLRISGGQGSDLENQDHFDILWIEDITAENSATEVLARELEAQEAEIERLRAAIDYLPAPIWLRNDKQEIILCNETYAKVIGSKVNEIIRDQKEIAQPSKTKSKTKKKKDAGPNPGPKLAKAALQLAETQTAQAHVVTKGDRLLMRIFEIPVRALSMTLGVARDITREEEIGAELKGHQSANREFLQQLCSAIGIYDADQKLVFYNTAFAQLWDIEEGWLNTKPGLGDIMEKLRETRHLPEQADFRKFKKSWLDMFTRLISAHEDMLYLPDGSALRMLAVPNPMGGLMMTFEDVTSRLELESSYNTLIAVQKETLDNLAEAVAVFGTDGRLKLRNPSFGHLWNLNPEDLEGEPHVTRIVEKMKPFFKKQEWEKKKDEMVSLGLDRLMHEGRLEREDETLIDYTTVPLPDGGVLITYSDVTDTVQVENALRDKNAALETAEKLKLDFLANVSYQLRTPLNAIMGFNEILDQEYFGPLNERQKTYTHDMKEASEKLLGLINDILDLSSFEAGYLTLNRETVKIGEMLQGLIDLVSGWARKEQIEVNLSCPKNIGTLEADEARLKQAIINLIRNAITFTPEGGTITVEAKRTNEGLEISVNDTGIGIEQEDQSRILEPFERAHGGSSEKRGARRGAGLGLSLVKNIAALHGGTINLVSKPGEGTSVTLFLPEGEKARSEKTKKKKSGKTAKKRVA